jgi:hypothetical protein
MFQESERKGKNVDQVAFAKLLSPPKVTPSIASTNSCSQSHVLAAVGATYFQPRVSGTVRVPMFSVLRSFDAPEILMIASAALFLVGRVFVYLF